jgi:microcystin-dependent protein
MSEPFLAEVRIFTYNFAPIGWALCNGQLLPISQNTALFSLLGTNYGGDGRSTFGLPNLQGRTPVGQGQGPGLSPYDLGQDGGAETVTLAPQELPNHTHSLVASGEAATQTTPSVDRRLAKPPVASPAYAPAQNLVAMAPVGAAPQPHDNRQPYCVLQFCIALQGIFPARN